MKAEKSGLRLQQMKDQCYKEFQKSPENPFNQATAAHNATRVYPSLTVLVCAKWTRKNWQNLLTWKRKRQKRGYCPSRFPSKGLKVGEHSIALHVY